MFHSGIISDTEKAKKEIPQRGREREKTEEVKKNMLIFHLALEYKLILSVLVPSLVECQGVSFCKMF